MLYVIADTCFGETDTAKKRGFETSEEMAKMIIEKWNSVVIPNDFVLHCGGVGRTTTKVLREIIPQLNGKKKLLLGEKDNFFNKEVWKTVGFDICLRSPSIYTFTKGDKEIVAGFPYKKKGETEQYKYDIATFYIDGIEGGEPIIGNTLNISASLWDYTPIKMTETLNIYEHLKSFAEMEDFNNKEYGG